jgi:hypothetical protein
MSDHTVSVDVDSGTPVQIVTVAADGFTLDVTLPTVPAIEVDLPGPQPPLSVDVVAAPPVVVVDTPAPLPTPNVDVELPDPITVDVIAPPPTAVMVDAIAAWQSGIPDAPATGLVYGRLNNQWASALGLLAPYAPLNSPALVGVPTAPTPTAGSNSTQIATTQFVEQAIGFSVHPDLVTSVAAKVGDVLLYTTDLEDWSSQVLDGGSF